MVGQTVRVLVGPETLRWVHKGEKAKIPSVCIGLGTKHLTPYEMLHRKETKFVLEVQNNAMGL